MRFNEVFGVQKVTGSNLVGPTTFLRVFDSFMEFEVCRFVPLELFRRLYNI